MLVDLIFMLVISLFVFHAYITTQNQFAATASAIRQIWSGGCPLSCRQSEYSRVSGFSTRPTSQTGPCRTMPPQGTQPGHSRECACESCPCVLIENFLSNCRPATNMYTQLVDCTLNSIYYCLQMILDAYNYIRNVLECQATCQQLEAPDLNPANQRHQRDSKENNFSFGKDEKAKITDKLKRLADITHKESKISLDKAEDEHHKNKKTSQEQIPKSSKVIESKIKSGTSKEEVGKLLGGHQPQTKLISDSAPKADGSKQNLTEGQKGVCSKCIEKGRVCVKECPKAKKK